MFSVIYLLGVPLPPPLCLVVLVSPVNSPRTIGPMDIRRNLLNILKIFSPYLYNSMEFLKKKVWSVGRKFWILFRKKKTENVDEVLKFLKKIRNNWWLEFRSPLKIIIFPEFKLSLSWYLNHKFYLICIATFSIKCSSLYRLTPLQSDQFESVYIWHEDRLLCYTWKR